jgi:hypothetical protein
VDRAFKGLEREIFSSNDLQISLGVCGLYL